MAELLVEIWNSWSFIHKSSGKKGLEPLWRKIGVPSGSFVNLADKAATAFVVFEVLAFCA